MSTRRFGGFGLVVIGALGGILVSLAITAVAQRGEPLPLRDLQQFANVFAAIKNSYVEPVTDEQLIQEAIKGLFNDLDPHSAYLDAEAFKEMETITQGGFGGLGIEIGSEDGMPKVIAPIEDTPAARAGVLSGDLITHIDGKPTKGMTLSDAIKLMRGKPKTSIVLTIKREGREKPLVVPIVRDHIKVRSVRSKMLENDIAYIRVAQFQERTESDLAKQLGEMANQGAKALVLDLRNDPGGLLDSAIGVSSMFMDSNGLIVSTKGRIPSANREYHSKISGSAQQFLQRPLAGAGAKVKTVGDWVETVPMVVLVNVGSASASEIVAGALQDYDRAKVMGNRTFGKGSVQSVLPLSESTGIKLTTARYYTPKGRSIQVTGVEPDIIVDDTARGNLFSLPREVDLQRHLVNGAIPELSSDDDEYGAVVENPKMFEFGGEDDFQLKQAINQLEGRPVRRNDPVKIAESKAANLTGTVDGDADPADSNAAASETNNGAAEKKSPVNPLSTTIERYRVTPHGLIRTQNE